MQEARRIGTILWARAKITSHLARIIHRSRGASLAIRHHSAFASLTNTTSIRSVTENAAITTTLASHPLSGELSRLASHLGAKGSRKNNFTFWHPTFRPSSPAPQSQNPRISAASPTVLLNRRKRIRPKSERQNVKLFLREPQLSHLLDRGILEISRIFHSRGSAQSSIIHITPSWTLKCEVIFARALTLVLAALIFCASAQAQVSVQMSANRNRLTTDENVVVQIEVEVSGGEEPDIELPSFDKFEIVQQQVSRPMQFSFSFGTNRGTRRTFRSTTQYTFVLRPYQEGRITIAPVRVSVGGKDFKSNALTLVVGKGSGPSAPADPTQSQQQTDDNSQSAMDYVDATDFDRKAFLRMVVDKAEAFVGEQVTATIYLYVRSRLTSNPSIETEPNTEGFWIHDLMQAKANLRPKRQIVKGIPFTVYPLRRFAAFPLRSGELSIGSMTVSIERNSLFDLFNRGGFEPTLRRASVPVTIQVKDLPEKDKPQDEVAVGSFSVSAKFDRDQVATGDAVKLTATVTGSGNLSTVSLPEPKISGVQVLKPEIRDLIESPNDLVGGTKVFEWLLIPQSPGEIKIGTIDLPVFSPEEKRYRIERSEPLTLTVVGRSIIAKEDDETTATEPSAEQEEDAANAFGPIRTSSALSRNPSRLVRRAWYYWVLALGPSLWLLILGASAVRRRLEANSQKTAPKRAVREAKQRLNQAIGRASRGDTKSYYGDIAAAITTVLEVRLGEATGGYTLTELRTRLTQRGMNEPLASQVVKQLETCDFLRFGSAGTSPDEIKEHARTARELFQQLQDFTPTTEEVKA